MRRMIVAITGASGACYGVQALKMLRELGTVETHLIVSPAGVRTAIEEGVVKSREELREFADVCHSHKDIGASIASGSFRCDGMLVAPCSIKTLSAIANCYDSDLITRAADVCLKERRRVVLMVRETPLHAGHIALMEQATRSGAIIICAGSGFATQDDRGPVRQTAGRALDLFRFRSSRRTVKKLPPNGTISMRRRSCRAGYG